MKNVIPVTEARKNIFKLVHDVNAKGERYLLTEKGRAKAVLMSAEEFDSWQETLEVMRDFPNLHKDAKEAEEAYRKGDYVNLDELLVGAGYIVSDKKASYEVQGRSSKKHSKKASKIR